MTVWLIGVRLRSWIAWVHGVEMFKEHSSQLFCLKNEQVIWVGNKFRYGQPTLLTDGPTLSALSGNRSTNARSSMKALPATTNPERKKKKLEPGA